MATTGGVMTAVVWMDGVLIGSAVIGWLAVGMVLICLARMRRQLRATHKLCERLRHELAVANSSAIGMGQRLVALERKLDTTASRQLQLEKQDVDQLSYTQAARLFNSGIQAEEVARSCGLSRAEASLMEMMRQHY